MFQGSSAVPWVWRWQRLKPPQCQRPLGLSTGRGPLGAFWFQGGRLDPLCLPDLNRNKFYDLDWEGWLHKWLHKRGLVHSRNLGSTEFMQKRQEHTVPFSGFTAQAVCTGHQAVQLRVHLAVMAPPSDRDCKPLHSWENGRWLQDQMHPGPSKLLLLWCSPSLSRLLSLTFFLQLPDMWVVVPVSNCYKIKNSNVNKTPCLVHSRSLKMFPLALLRKLCSSKLKC